MCTENDEPRNSLPELAFSSNTIHADDFLNGENRDVAPPLHFSTTFRYSNNPELLIPAADHSKNHPNEAHIYSRISNPNTTRFEAILSSILKGPSLTYSSGLSAFHALLVFLNPKNISITDGYHGCHGVIEIHRKLTGLKKLSLKCDSVELQAGDIIHVETPLNPSGKAINLKYFAEKAHSCGAFLIVDATFGPPPLQDPFKWGADVVIHSGTKFISGHSDMLCGILAVNPIRAIEGWHSKLVQERIFLGNVMGSMEGWLGIRSIRTLELRVKRQSYNTTRLVEWLDSTLKSNITSTAIHTGVFNTILINKLLVGVEHASLQKDCINEGWLLQQMPNGFGSVFSLMAHDEMIARKLPSKLKLFHHATSLGGVESLIEWRSMSDSTVDSRLLRISVGVEDWQDLRDDLLQGLEAIAKELMVS